MPAIKEGTRIKKLGEDHVDVRSPVQVSLGVHVNGAALPHPDLNHVDTAIAGVKKRFAFRPPTADPQLLDELQQFVRQWLKENLTPLPHDTDVSVDTWLNTTNYPAWRRKQLRETFESMEGTVWNNPKIRKCKSFVKDECYPEYKHARAINSRSDAFKCLVGPIFKQIEKRVFDHPAFIKKVPVRERAAYIMERLYSETGKYVATDYSSFESLFTRALMLACELELYSYMTKNLPDHREFMRICDRVLAGRNTCQFKKFIVQVEATRMSGEMCTSLGNGFSNLMFMEFLCHKVGSKYLIGVVEGDDGLNRVEGPCPTAEDFAKLGLVIKLEVHDRIETASFCGLVFDPEEQVNVTNPVDALLKFGWTTRNYASARQSKLNVLLRASAMSMKYQYDGCPILWALADYGLRVTHSLYVNQRMSKYIHKARMNWYERNELLEALEAHIIDVPSRRPGPKTRLLVEELYGISVEAQIRIENYLLSKLDLSPLDFEQFADVVQDVHRDYYERYCRTAPVSHPVLYNLDFGIR